MTWKVECHSGVLIFFETSSLRPINVQSFSWVHLHSFMPHSPRNNEAMFRGRGSARKRNIARQKVFKNDLPLHSTPDRREKRHIFHISEGPVLPSLFSSRDIPDSYQKREMKNVSHSNSSSRLSFNFGIHSVPRKCFSRDSAEFGCACTPARCSRRVVHSVYLLSREIQIGNGHWEEPQKETSPIPQNVKYLLNTSTSRSVNSSCPVNYNQINLRLPEKI